jgi:predicted transcriptional regulator of viral defense system/very-short-patch-repair endonuclease
VGDKQQGQSDLERPIRHKPLFELATRQHGVVSTWQLKQIGYGRNSASKANKVGRLRRLHRGVYAVGHEHLSWHAWCMAAVLACDASGTGRAVASHTASGWLWNILRTSPATIHITVPTPRHRRRDLRLHTARLSEADVDEVDGIPVTGLARTVLDLAPMNSMGWLERAVEGIEDSGRFDLVEFEALFSRSGRHPGIGRLREVLAIYQEDPAFTRSKMERRFRRLVRKAGLPMPAANVSVAGIELDAYWEAERFAVELDVYGTHGTRAAFERDRMRGDDLLLLGIEMIRVTGPRLRREPEAVIHRVAAHLERRRVELSRQTPIAQ